jgi:hypothetical protein
LEFLTCLFRVRSAKSQKIQDGQGLAWQMLLGWVNPFCGGEVMETQAQDWRALSEAASREQDPQKLMELVEQLNRALLRRELQMKRCFSATTN